MKKSHTGGFTLLELLIALAIIAIIAAILIPNFFATTDRARLRSDIQSARVIQSAIELYRAERNAEPAGIVPAGGGAPNAQAIVDHLYNADFLNSNSAPQTEGAVWAWDTTRRAVVVNIAGSTSDGVHDAFRRLSETEQRYVTGGRGASND